MLTKCPECSKDISDKATSCPNCGFPIGHNLSVNYETLPEIQTSNQESRESKPNDLNVEELNRSLTERFTSSKSEDEIRNLIGRKFKELEPKFDPELLAYGIGNTLFTQVTLRNVTGNEWLITVGFQEDDKDKKQYAYFGMGALLLYALFTGKTTFAFVLVIAIFAVGLLNSKYEDKLNSKGVETCLRNLKAELDRT